MVSNLEATPLQEIELLIEKEVESENTRLAGVLTGRNMREFILYTSQPKAVEEDIEKIKVEIKSHELQYIVQHDPEWNTYKFMIGK